MSWPHELSWDSGVWVAVQAALDSLALAHNEHLVPMATANLRMYLRMESHRQGEDIRHRGRRPVLPLPSVAKEVPFLAFLAALRTDGSCRRHPGSCKDVSPPQCQSLSLSESAAFVAPPSTCLCF